MSILAADAAKDAAEPVLFSVIFCAVGVTAAALLFRPRRVRLPDRIPPHLSGWSLLGVVGAAFIVWVAAQLGFALYKQLQFQAAVGAATAPAPFTEADLTPEDYAFLATVPWALAFVALIGGDALLGVARSLGISLRSVIPGLLRGLVAILAILPLVYLSGALTEWVYQRVGYQHPAEHDLLRLMRDAKDPAIRMLLIAGAVIVAPVAEEALFRGHLQTLVRRAITRVGRGRREPYGFPVVFANDAASPMPPGAPASVGDEPPFPPSPPVQDPPTVGATWGAIVLTSAAFAAVHPMWTWPPIFFLSLCLGYAYERTGNVWTSVTIHALFNGFSTLTYYLYFIRSD